MLAAVVFVAGHAALLLALLATAWVAGRLICQCLRLPRSAHREAMAVAVGLAALAHAGFALAWFGALGRGPIVGVALAAHLLGAGIWRRTVVAAVGVTHAVSAGARAARRWWVAAGAAGVVLFLLVALYPPHAFDETLYHLPFARAFWETGALPVLPDLRLPVFPVLSEVLFAAMLAFGDDVSTHLVSLLALFATAALLATIAPYEGRSTGRLAAAMLLGAPLAVYLGGTAYVEPTLALFATAATAAVVAWRRGEGREWLWLAGGLAGTACAVKYLGLVFLAVLIVWVGSVALRDHQPSDLFRFAAAALMTMAPSYLRVVMVSGNPLFPFYPELFGASAWAYEPLAQGFAQRLQTLVTLPWDLLFRRALVGGQPPCTPFVLAWPLAVLAIAKRGHLRPLALIVVVYLIAVPTVAHYLFAVVPLACWLLAEGVAAAVVRLRWRGALLRAATLTALLTGPAYAVRTLWLHGPPPATTMAREAFLERRLPLYASVRALNRIAGGDRAVYAVHAENLVYYSRARWLGDWNGVASFARILPPDGDPAVLASRLRALGVEYLFIARRSGYRLAGTGAPWFEPVFSDGEAVVYRLAGAE